MKRFVLTILLILFLPAICFAWGEMGKIDDLIKAGKHNPSRLNQAIEMLESIIEKDPDNHKAYFKLGEVYTTQGRYGQADREFKTANEFHNYKKQIGTIFKAEYNKAIRSGKQAKQLYQLTSFWDSSFRSSAGKNLFNNGEQALKSGQVGVATNYFDFLVSVDPSYKNKISDLYFEKGQYKASSKYSKKHNNDIFNLYMKKAKASKDEQEKQKWRNLAGKYGEVPPDFKVYEIGEHVFNLKKGQITDHWIRTPRGVRTRLNFFYSDNSKYELIYRDGTIVSNWKNDALPNESDLDFKIRAIEPSNVLIKIKLIN